MDELKPCPFCGGKAKRHVSVFTKQVQVYCSLSNRCRVHPCTDFYEKQKDADESWNKRAKDDNLR